GAGDVNGDDFADVIVGASLDDDNGSFSGSAKVYSGADGSLLHTFSGAADSSTGFSVDGVGDINGDAVPDLLVGSPDEGNNGDFSGAARIYSGADGSVLQTFNGDGEDDAFGVAVAAAGDVNGDGKPDVIVGAEQASPPGYARVFGEAAICVDGDADGYGDPASDTCMFPELDCDDANMDVNPGANETRGNGPDDDCDVETPDNQVEVVVFLEAVFDGTAAPATVGDVTRRLGNLAGA
ncbi:MAG: FG-GAP repeat protein, partial [Myxococcales bacterium]|nr:FG-GAP repeat protein [Myxococcales bacterium]